jgi:Toprim domain
MSTQHPRPASLIPIAELKAKIKERLPAILFDLLRNVKNDGPDRWKGDAPNGDRIAVQTGGPKKGYVYNTTGSRRGDGNLFNVILDLHCDGNEFEACRFCERILGLDPDGYIPDPARAEHQRLAEQVKRKQDEELRRERYDKWLSMYHRGKPVTLDSLGGRYLLGRCCPLSPLLRDGRSPFDGSPVMLAPMIDPKTLAIKAIHVTDLVEHGRVVLKSPKSPSKRTPGWPYGCVIPLCHGVSGLSLKMAQHKDLKEPLLIAEGIENSLTVHREFPDLRVFAAGAVDRLVQARLPHRFNRIILVRDRERPGNLSAAGARQRAIEQWLQEKRRVELIDPPAPFKDVNDAARAFEQR